MSIYTLACPTVGCYQNFNCDPEFLNKVVAVAFIKKTYAGEIDKTTAESWMNSLFDAMLEGQGVLVFNVSGEKPKPDTATVAGRGMQTTKALAKTHTLNYQDMQGIVYGNVLFYNDMLSNSAKYDFYYFTPNRIWDASGNYITVIGDPVITAELNTYQMADVSVQWVSKTNPLPYEFDTDSFLEGLYFEIVDATTLLTPDTSFTFTSATSQNTNWTAQINQSGMLAVGTPIWSLQKGQNEANLVGLTINPSTGNLTETGASTNGIYGITVVVSNAAGCVFGTLDITVEIAID
jgi:hypothetical protein